MRSASLFAIVTAVACVSSGQFALANGQNNYCKPGCIVPPDSYQQSSREVPAVHTQVRARNSSDTWAAVAVSEHPGKDAFGFEYLKTSADGAETAAIRFCEERFQLKGIRNGRCAVRSSTEYVIGAYCVSNGRAHAAIGIGPDPASAADAMFGEAGSMAASRCYAVKMRHGSRNKREIDGGTWHAVIQCNGRTYRGRGVGAIGALNNARNGVSGSLGSCRVIELDV